MHRPLTEIQKSIPTTVIAGVKREVRHTKNSRTLRKMTPAQLAEDNAARARVGLHPRYQSQTLRQRLTTIAG